MILRLGNKPEKTARCRAVFLCSPPLHLQPLERILLPLCNSEQRNLYMPGELALCVLPFLSGFQLSAFGITPPAQGH
jgi:hypothetical protein